MITHWSDCFFGPLYVRFDELRSERISDDVFGIIRLCSIGRHNRVVELCCGYGRLLIPLVAKTGARATGIDKSSTLLAGARASANEQNVSIQWKEADLITFRGRYLFDVAYIAGTSFGYYDESEKNLRVLEAARSCLKRGGTFLLGQWNVPSGFRSKKEDGEFIYERESSFNPASNVYAGSYCYRDKITKQAFTYKFSVVLYRRHQLLKMLTESGFGEIRFFGGLDGRPFEEKGKRLVVVCKAI